MKYSVVATFYNSPDPETAINSALTQNVKPSEVIVVDDCSDSIFQEQLKYIANSKGCIFYTTPKNLGPAGARNLGIEKSKNDFVIFMDDDDFSLAHRAEIHLRNFQSNADLSYVSTRKNYTNGHFFEAINESFNGNLEKIALSKYLLLGESSKTIPTIYIPACSLAIRKSAFENSPPFDEQFRRLEDVDLALTASSKGLNFLFDSEVGVIRNSSIGTDKSSEAENRAQYQILRKYSSFFNLKEIRRISIWNIIRNLYFEKKYFKLISYLLLFTILFGIDIKKIRNSGLRLMHDIKRRQ